jgi:4-hydroxy-2-oxoheptanedioate aldolase
MSTPHSLRTHLSQKKPVVGVWSIIPSPALIEVLGSAGMDFLILDMEHGPYDLPVLEHCIRACEVASCAPLVRVPSVSPTAIQSALDVGAQGIVVPRITGLTEARQALSCMYFAPRGTRGFNPFTRSFRYNPQNPKLAEHHPISCLIIENEGALKDLPDILALPDLDVIYIGVYDLAVALGHGGDVRHPKLHALVQEVVRACVNAGKTVGLMVRSAEELQQALAMGVGMVVWKTDTSVVREAATAIMQQWQHVQGHSSS